MIARVLDRGVQLARAHSALLNFLLPLGLALAVCGTSVAYLNEHDARVRSQDAALRDARIAAARTAHWMDLWSTASDALLQKDGVVTQTATVYRTLRDTIRLDLERAHSDTPKLLRDLPVFLRASDSAQAACSEFQVSCAAYRRVTDSLVASMRAEQAVLLLARVYRPPRLSADAEVLYDPLSATPAATGAVAFHVAGPVSLVLRGEERFALGERPRAYVGLRITH